MGPWRHRPPRAGRVERFWLAIPTRAGERLAVWEVSREAVVEIEAPPAGAWPILSLDEADLRVVTEARCTDREARRRIRRQCGQPPRIINASREGVIYGRPAASLSDERACLPAARLIDRVLQARGWPGAPFVVGLLLSAPGSPNEILALWAGTPRRELSSVQVTENAQQVEQIIEAFCAKHSIATEGAEALHLFDIEAWLAALTTHAAALKPYPLHDGWLGIRPERAWASAAVMASVLACALVIELAVELLVARASLAGAQAARERAASARQSVGELIERHVPTLCERASVDVRALVHWAHQAYAAGGRVSLQSAGPMSRVRLALPIEADPAGAAQSEPAQTNPVVRFERATRHVVAGASPQVSVAEGGNEIDYDYALAADHRRLLDHLDR